MTEGKIVIEIKKRRGRRLPSSRYTKPVTESTIPHSITIAKKVDKNVVDLDEDTKFKDLSVKSKKKPLPRKIIISKPMTFKDLSLKTGLSEKNLLQKSSFSAKDMLSPKEAKHICEELGLNVKLNILEKKKVLQGQIQSRPPIVVVMGHVDHGKTSLLDKIRSTNVTAREAGNITQSVSAYHVDLKDDKKITFVDTPGHAFFTKMRETTLSAADISILLVSAADGVKEQTIESIKIAKELKIPLVVAFNKMDIATQEQINQCRYKLLDNDVVVESLGGEVLEVPISAKTGENIDLLMESILLQAELMDLHTDNNAKAQGVVIESHMSKSLGPICTVIIRNGQLKKGDDFIIGSIKGRVKIIMLDGKSVNSATAALPVQVIGAEEVVTPGTPFTIDGQLLSKTPVSTHKALNIKDIDNQNINVFIKANSRGALDALNQAIMNLKLQENKKIKIVSHSTGNILDGDVELCLHTQSVMLAFDVKSSLRKTSLKSINCFQSNIVYKVIDDFMAFIKEKYYTLGQGKVIKIFDLKIGVIAGCLVEKGEFLTNRKIHIIHNGKVVYNRIPESIKIENSNVQRVSVGQECGIFLGSFRNFSEGDKVVCV